MSLTIFSTTDPKAGEEQPLSSTSNLISSWTMLDISAAFPDGKVPYNTTVSIIIGADLPREEHLIESKMLGKFIVRKFGDSTPPGEASGIRRYNLSNENSVIYRDGEEYQSGGFLAILSIPVDTNGKFEYQLQNDSISPRIIVRLLKVITVEEVPDSIPVTEKGVANGVATLDGSVLVVENPASATATPAPGKIPISDGSGKLDAWVSIPSVPSTFEVVDRITVEASHTGDTAETEIGKLTIPGGKMGPNGLVRIKVTGRPHRNAQFTVYWGQIQPGHKIGHWSVAGADYLVYSRVMEVWNKGATNTQGADSAAAPQILAKFWIANGQPLALAEDTTQDVDVYVTTQLGNPADTSYLYLAVAEVCYGD